MIPLERSRVRGRKSLERFGSNAAFALTLPAMMSSTVGHAQDREGCGGVGEPCNVELGTSHVQAPEPSQAKGQAVLFFRSYGGSGSVVLRNDRVTGALNAAGYTVLAPNGLEGPNGQSGWSFIPGRPERRDELAFASQVLDDAERRLGIDRGRVLVAGFSIGGSLTWHLAYRDPLPGRTFAPVSGAF